MVADGTMVHVTIVDKLDIMQDDVQILKSQWLSVAQMQRATEVVLMEEVLHVPKGEVSGSSRRTHLSRPRYKEHTRYQATVGWRLCTRILQ